MENKYTAFACCRSVKSEGSANSLIEFSVIIHTLQTSSLDKASCHFRSMTPRVRGINTAGGESASASANTGSEPNANEVNVNSNWVKVWASTVTSFLLTFFLSIAQRRNLMLRWKFCKKLEDRQLTIDLCAYFLSLTLSVRLSRSFTSLLFLFVDGIEPFFWPSVLHVALYKTVFLDFWFRPKLTPQNLHKIA